MTPIENRIVAHHVGGRGFGVALNCPPDLSAEVVNVLYEADEVCARAMMAENTAGNLHVLPFCLGKENASGKLFITKNPYASSNFEPDASYYPYYCELHLSGEVEGVMLNNAVYDVVYGNDFSVAETRDVQIRALDDILARKEAPDGLVPDFLSLDTQGSELNILKGGEQTFHDHCLALATEIEFHPMYKNQALFSDIFDFALKHGFHFVGFTYLQEISPHRLPLGARAKGVLAFGDALFFRDISSVRSIATSENDLYAKLMKLAFIAMNFGYLEYAIQVLEEAALVKPDKQVRDSMATRKWHKFLTDLHLAVSRLPRDLPHFDRTLMIKERKAILDRQLQSSPSASDTGTACAAGPGSTTASRPSVENRRIRHLIFTNPGAAITKLLRHFGFVKADAPAPVEIQTIPDTQVPNPAAAPGSLATTEVEAVLEKYGYSWWADTVRQRRKSAEHCIPGRMH
ncbi:MAG: FkbM family methyltransferase [Proteobacteria bacterium]|nr:FkbM family methyltransferase [Pseudomonadota bacterium]